MKFLGLIILVVLEFTYGKASVGRNDDVLVGDMLLTQDQIDDISGNLDTRKARKGTYGLWPKGEVLFHIDRSSEKDRAVIMKAIDHWRDNTCIKFFEFGGSAGAPHLNFKKLQGCYSPVGRNSRSNGQTISIGKNCETMGIIAHEIGHSIGFYHEQNRPDRDEYVVVFNENIKENDTNQYVIYTNIITYGVKYDINSLMHYGSADFTGNGKNTISPIDPMEEFKIGQREALSFYDIKLANLMYNCSALCKKQPAECNNGGFVDRLCQCKCPPGFTGQSCDEIVPMPEPSCGGIITEPTTLKSPENPMPNTQCVWHVKAPEDKRVKVVFKEFNLHSRNKMLGKCIWDYLEVRSGYSIYHGDKFCGGEIKGQDATSEQNFLLLFYKSRDNDIPGFEAEITFV